jgi:class 3 adenylate cyclase
MESSGESGAIHVTEAIYDGLKERYLFEDRGFINIKGKGDMQTYFLLGQMGE